MSKAFTSEETPDEPPLFRAPPTLLPGQKRFITRAGFLVLQAQRNAWEEERALLLKNGDPPTGRVQQLASSIHALQGTLNILTVAEPPTTDDPCVRLGSTVTLRDGHGKTRTVRVVGPDEVDGKSSAVSMESPLGRALLGVAQGENVEVELPRGEVAYAILAVEQP